LVGTPHAAQGTSWPRSARCRPEPRPCRCRAMLKLLPGPAAPAPPGALPRLVHAGDKQRFPRTAAAASDRVSWAGGYGAGAPCGEGTLSEDGERSRGVLWPSSTAHGTSAAVSEERAGAGIGLSLLPGMKTGKYPFCLQPRSLSRAMGSQTERRGRGGQSRCPARRHVPG